MRRLRLVELRGERAGARFELGAGFLEALRRRRPARRALDQGRVGGPGFGRALAEILGGLARLEQAALRRGQPLVGGALIVSSRAIDSRASSWRRSSASRSSSACRRSRAELLVLLVEAGRLVLGVLELRVVRHDRLFLLVVLGLQRRDRIRRLGNRGLERRGFCRRGAASVSRSA